MSVVPDTLYRYKVPRRTVRDTRQLLAGPGALGFEAAALWLGTVVDQTIGEIIEVVRPKQTAYETVDGVGLELDEQALTDLILGLPDDVFALVRLHTHPTGAFHSPVDDANLVIGRPGAISIVVPNFAAGPIELSDCAVHELRNGQWRALSGAEINERFTVT